MWHFLISCRGYVIVALWVVRAGKDGEREQFALEENVVVIGSPVMSDLSGLEREQFSELLSVIDPEANPHQIGNRTGHLWRFVREIKEGDIVALPLKTRSEVAFGRITGTYRYDSNAPDDARHQRPVQWMNTSVPRINIDEDLRVSLDVLNTVFAVPRKYAARIESLLEGKSKSAFSSPQEGEEEEEDGDTVSFDMHRWAEDQVIDFIGRNFKGHDFARLVAGVLTAQGYKVQTSPPGPDGGVDIVAGRGPMGFEAPRLCVQVKSGDAQVGVTVLRELQGVMKKLSRPARADRFLEWLQADRLQRGATVIF